MRCPVKPSSPARASRVHLIRRAAALPLLVLSLLLIASAAAAQEQNANEPVILMGQVIDAQSGQPMPGVVVEFTELKQRTATDRDGTFRFRVRPGAHALMVRQIGYDTEIRLWKAESGAAPITIALQPNPVQLEALRVQVDRFERRRRAVAVSIRVFERKDLALSAAPSARDFVLERTGVIRVNCSTGAPNPFAFSDDCILARGRPVSPTVYIDEAPALAGLEQLAMYRPQELYRVEVYAGGRHIRAYSNWFMERASRRTLTPIPFF